MKSYEIDMEDLLTWLCNNDALIKYSKNISKK